MQHLDEGTIHSWLDGALSADEGARAEGHVAECSECAAAVAEARGFIAASSRILTALDNVPRGVVPAAAPARRSNRVLWRAAAAVLVVAGGSLVVVRSGEDRASVVPAVFDSARAPAAVMQPQIAAPSREASEMPKASAPATGTPPAARANSSRATLSGKPTASTAQPSVPVRKQTLSVQGAVAGAVADAVADAVITENPASSQVAAAPAPQTFGQIRLRGATSMGAAPEPPSLKVVGRPRQIGAKITLYEVAPGDTVTLTELVSFQMNSVVTTGIATDVQSRQSTGKSVPTAAVRRADAAVVSAPDSQQAAAAAREKALAARAPAAQAEVANGVTTITWPDAITGNVLKLSGRMPEARLQQVKIAIERERAAAAAKKNP